MTLKVLPDSEAITAAIAWIDEIPKTERIKKILPAFGVALLGKSWAEGPALRGHNESAKLRTRAVAAMGGRGGNRDRPLERREACRTWRINRVITEFRRPPIGRPPIG